jgi:hypothetical protein
MSGTAKLRIDTSKTRTEYVVEHGLGLAETVIDDQREG